MSNIFDEYDGALKYFFAKAFEGTKPQDWISEPKGTNEKGQTVCEFENARKKQFFSVTDQGDGENGASHKFGINGPEIEANISIPASWKGVQV